MAAATVTSTGRPTIIGDLAMITAKLTLAGTGDTFDASTLGFASVDNVILSPPSTVSVSASISGTTATFTYTGGGAMTGVLATVIGRY